MWEQLIQVIKEHNTTEAIRLIQELDGKTYNWWVGLKELDRTDKNGNTALCWAVSEGMEEVCELLIAKMSIEAINAVNNNGNTALMVAALRGMNEMCKLLLPQMTPEAVNAVSNYGETALHWAASQGMKEICELLLLQMTSEAINADGVNGWTVLHLAAEAKHKEICRILIENMHAKKIIALLKQSSSVYPIQKAIGEIVADFIKDKFLDNEINPMDFTGYQIKLLKLYQVVDRDLLKSYLNEEKCVSSANNCITKHYFTLIGVCKSINEDSPISSLVLNDDCMSCMLPYLAPHSLCPELLPKELLGENEKETSENEGKGCTLV